MADSIHAKVDADETNARIHDGEFETLDDDCIGFYHGMKISATQLQFPAVISVLSIYTSSRSASH